MDGVDVPELVERMGSDEDAVRKMAVFKLQSSIGDPSFADAFISDGGLTRLRYLVLHATGNTLAYSLTSFSRLLEVDKGWDYVNEDVVERVVELVVTHPLVNILRGAMSILGAIVSRQQPLPKSGQVETFGFRALKPAVAIYPQFLEMLVSRLSSADHALCANALQLINSLMRDAILTDSGAEWPRFIKRLQDLDVIKAVYILMQSTALQDLAHPLQEFQALTKVLLRRWRDTSVDLHKTEHRRALKGIHLASNPEKFVEQAEIADESGEKKHNPEKWRRLGFESENPGWEFEETGYLGMMDLTDYIRRHDDNYRKLLLEQSNMPPKERCPVARASLAVTAILYEHFEVDKSDLDDAKGYIALESKSNYEKIFRPLILQWSKLHIAGLQAFFRLWKATGANREDFVKIVELVRILLEAVVGGATRTKNVHEVEEEIQSFDYQRLRQLQMELFEITYEDTWGHHLRQVRDELSHEALQFVKEQRIRCLLAGAWFPTYPGSKTDAGRAAASQPSSFCYAKLSHNRRYLHYADFESRGEHDDEEPEMDMLHENIDLSIVSSVSSNISANSVSSARSSFSTLRQQPASSASTKITIHRYLHVPPSSSADANNPNAHSRNVSKSTAHAHKPSSQSRTHNNSNSQSNSKREEVPLLTLYPATQSLASEWLDGLLMLLGQKPITAETMKLIDMVSGYGLKIRLLNVRFDERAEGGGGEVEVPSREGLDEDYYYDISGG